jgi:hypothetical protein
VPLPALARIDHGIWFNDHIEGDGPTVFKHLQAWARAS